MLGIFELVTIKEVLGLALEPFFLVLWLGYGVRLLQGNSMPNIDTHTISYIIIALVYLFLAFHKA